MKKIKITIYITLVLVFIIGVSAWALRTSNDLAKNNFTIADLNINIEENFQPPTDYIYFEDSYKKDVKIKNNSNQSIFIRVMALPQITIGEVVLETNGVILFDIDETNWENGQDGYYYYKKSLMNGETTASLFKNVTLSKSVSKDIYINSKFDIMVKSEACPITTNKTHVNSWWGGNMPTEEPLKSISEELAKIAESEGAK